MTRRACAALLVIGLVALLILVLWTGFFKTSPPTRGTVTSAADAPADAALVQRGAYLAQAGNCMVCHTARGGHSWAGGRRIDTPFGTLFASNLTPDPQTGLGQWTAEDFWQAMHNGKSRDGRLLYPAFPYPNYTRVTRADSDALFAYLRSLAPVAQENAAHQLRWPFSTQAALAVWRSLYFRPEPQREQPAQSAEWNRGAYLVQGLGHCSACHTARDALGGSRNLLDLSGGLIPMQKWYAPSLTSPAQAGLAAWDVAAIVQLMQTGVSRDASTLGPMAEVVLHSTQHLSPADLRAMAVYLKALEPTPAPARVAAVEPRVGVTERGARIYADHCVQCHGSAGQGVPGAYPRLAGNRAVTMEVTANLVQVVLGGGYPPATAGNPRPFGMPPYATVLSDPDVAAVLTYVRSAWGNSAPPVTELDVLRHRGGG